MSSRRLLIACALLAFACALILHTLVSPDGWRRRERARADLASVRDNNLQREAQVAQLRAEVAAMRSRPDVQERVVREELGFVRDGDVVLEVR